MTKEFVPYELAVRLKALGFNEPCIGFYNIDLNVLPIINEPYVTTSKDSAPLYQQAFRWFREKYELYSTIMFRVSMEDNNEYWDWLIKGEEVVYRHFKTYEEAELACLIKLIEIVVQQKQN